MELAWPLSEVYSAALRFVRIDRGCKVTERDAEAAYLLFECTDGEKTKRGSLELFPTRTEGREAVRAQVALDDPSYVEARFLDLLERKLRDERGTPPPLPKRPPTEAHSRPDGGA